MSNIIDKIQVSGVTYDIGGSGGGGNPTVELTQAEYDALVTAGTVSADTYYIITDAQAGDLTNYYTKSETNTLLGGKADTATTYTKTEVDTALGGKADTATTYTKTEVDNAITAATSTKQDTLVSGTNIKTINNTSILGSGNIDIQGGGGGGKAIEAGRGISITTGETADTVSFNLAISGGTYDSGVIENYSGNRALRYAHAEGYNTSAMTYYCHTEGENTIAKATGWGAHAEGSYTETSNYYEHASGKFNVSNRASSTWGDSGNTLFSVGNGTADNARHNAFEIRQNGDIYLSSGGTDIKLQDHLGGGGGSITIDPTLDSGSTNPVANSAITNVLSNYYYARKINNSIYNSPWGTKNSNGCVGFTLGFANILNPNDSVSSGVWISKINNKDLIYTNSDTPNANYFNLNLVETSAITTSVTSASTDSQVPSAKAVYDQLGGLKLVKLTQSAYDALSPDYDANTLYVIVN